VVPQSDCCVGVVGHEQLPPTQAVVGAAHRVPQAPQLVGSVSSLTQLVPQAVWSLAQVNVQTPFEHKGDPASEVHLRLQAPQLFASDWTLKHTPAQSLQPAGHTHTPAVQTYVAPQTLPQELQLLASFCTSTQVPPQSAHPGEHTCPHWPCVQVWSAAQALPQVPQFCRSPCRSKQTAPQSV
jgi:hypothetical protein